MDTYINIKVVFLRGPSDSLSTGDKNHRKYKHTFEDKWDALFCEYRSHIRVGGRDGAGH